MFRKLLSKIRKSKSESDLHEDSITVATFTNSFSDQVRIEGKNWLFLIFQKACEWEIIPQGYINATLDRLLTACESQQIYPDFRKLDFLQQKALHWRLVVLLIFFSSYVYIFYDSTIWEPPIICIYFCSIVPRVVISIVN